MPTTDLTARAAGTVRALALRAMLTLLALIAGGTLATAAYAIPDCAISVNASAGQALLEDVASHPECTKLNNGTQYNGGTILYLTFANSGVGGNTFDNNGTTNTQADDRVITPKGVVTMARSSGRTYFSYTSNASASGTDTFRVRIESGDGELGNYANYTVTIIPKTPAPDPLTATVAFASSNNVLTPTYSASGGPATSVAVATGPTNLGTVTVSGTSFNYTTGAGIYGTDTFTFTASNTGANNTTQTSAAQTATISIPEPTPNVTALTGSSGPAAGGNSVIINGTGFGRASAAGKPTVKFGNTTVPASDVTLNSSTQLTVRAPAGSGTVTVVVTNTNNSSNAAATAGNRYTYIAAPAVTGVSPPSGPAGTSVTITGSNLTGASAVRFGSTAASIFSNNGNQITTVAPSGVSGLVDVSVTTGGGTGTLADGFRFVPAAPTVTSPANNATTGSQPNYAGTAAANSTITVYVDGSPIATTTANSSGNWSQIQPTMLAYGSHTVYATATVGSDTSANSATRTFTAARTATPVVTTPANNSLVATTTPTYAGTAPANGTVTVTVDGAPIGTTTANGAGNWSLTQPTALSQGSHTVYTTAQTSGLDVSANSNTNSFTVDTVAPAAPVVVTPANGSTTTNDRPVISGTAEAGSSVQVLIDGNFTAPISADGAGNWSFTPTSSLALGSHTAAARATDAAGNISPLSATNTFTVARAPSVTQNPANATVAVGETAIFTVAGSGSPSPSIQWESAPAGSSTFTTLPNGGQVSGTTTTALKFSNATAADNGRQFRAVFTNSAGSATTTAATLTVVQAPTANAQSVTVATGTARAITLTGSDPNTPARTLTYAIATNPAHGTLSGFNASTGAVTYTPTSGYTGPDSFTFTVNNTVSTSAPATVSITVGSPITITPATLPDGAAETPYSQTLTASGGTAPYTYALTTGSLPAGLTLSSGGVLSGTPTDEGTSSFTVTASDGSSPAQTGSQAYTLAIAARTGGATRTWVSADGLDTASCSRANPCATFAAAFAKVATGGEINCVDNGAYGPLVITRSVSIICGDKLGRAAVTADRGGIVVDAPASAAVVLSGLDIDGLGNVGVNAGYAGVLFQSGGSLVLRNSTVRGTSGYGIEFRPNASASLYLDKVQVSGTGMLLAAQAGSVRATANRVQVTGSSSEGIRLEASDSATLAATIVRSVVSDNARTGVLATGRSGGIVRTAIVGSTVAGNAVGVSTGGTGSVTVVGDSSLIGNATGLATTAGANTATAGDNTLSGNGTDGAFTMSAANQ